MKKIAWCITGAGYMLKETFNQFKELKRKYPDLMITTFLSNAGEEVAKFYDIYSALSAISDGSPYGEVFKERRLDSSFFIAGRFYKGNYDLVIVSPMTANTAAKIAHGIADSLISCIVAMACKSRTRVVVLPTDLMPEYKTDIPIIIGGEKDFVRDRVAYSRDIDLDNIEKLRCMEWIRVIDDPMEILRFIQVKNS